MLPSKVLPGLRFLPLRVSNAVARERGILKSTLRAQLLLCNPLASADAVYRLHGKTWID